MLDFKTNVSCVLESVFAGFKDENIEIATENIAKLYVNKLKTIKAEIEKLNNTDYGSMFSYEAHKGAGDMQDDIIGIIENQILELKGEDR